MFFGNNRPAVETIIRWFEECFTAFFYVILRMGLGNLIPTDILVRMLSDRYDATREVAAKSFRGRNLPREQVIAFIHSDDQYFCMAGMYASVGRDDIPVEDLEAVLNLEDKRLGGAFPKENAAIAFYGRVLPQEKILSMYKQGWALAKAALYACFESNVSFEVLNKLSKCNTIAVYAAKNKPYAKEIILPALSSDDYRIRAAAFYACKDLGIDVSDEELQNGLSDSSSSVQIAAILSSKGRIPAQILSSFLSSADISVRTAALKICKKYGIESAPVRAVDVPDTVYLAGHYGVVAEAHIPASAHILRPNINPYLASPIHEHLYFATEAIITGISGTVFGEPVCITPNPVHSRHFGDLEMSFYEGDHIDVTDLDDDSLVTHSCEIGFPFFLTLEEAKRYSHG